MWCDGVVGSRCDDIVMGWDGMILWWVGVEWDRVGTGSWGKEVEERREVDEIWWKKCWNGCKGWNSNVCKPYYLNFVAFAT